jgi:hypothetical protein
MIAEVKKQARKEVEEQARTVDTHTVFALLIDDPSLVLYISYVLDDLEWHDGEVVGWSDGSGSDADAPNHRPGYVLVEFDGETEKWVELNWLRFVEHKTEKTMLGYPAGHQAGRWWTDEASMKKHKPVDLVFASHGVQEYKEANKGRELFQVQGHSCLHLGSFPGNCVPYWQPRMLSAPLLNRPKKRSELRIRWIVLTLACSSLWGKDLNMYSWHNSQAVCFNQAGVTAMTTRVRWRANFSNTSPTHPTRPISTSTLTCYIPFTQSQTSYSHSGEDIS